LSYASARSRNDWAIWYWLAIVVASITFAVTVSSHALARHGTEAITAHEVIVQSGHCRPCVDGRVRCVAKAGNKWAVEIRDGDVQITSFFTLSQAYVKGVTDECGNGDFWDHP
jgi:hypothetical protein